MSKKQSHTGFRNGALFCFHCGTSYEMNLPQPVTIMSAIMKQFDKDHKLCAKTWEEPQADANGKSEKENADWWLSNGERGISSETMFHYLDGRNIRIGKYEGHPSDPDDFKRCYKLLKAVPQFKHKLHLMKPVSEVWSKLVDNWDKLTEMLEEQFRTKKANGMYEFMESLGC